MHNEKAANHRAVAAAGLMPALAFVVVVVVVAIATSAGAQDAPPTDASVAPEPDGGTDAIPEAIPPAPPPVVAEPPAPPPPPAAATVTAAPTPETIVVAPAPPTLAPREDETASASVITGDRTARSGESLTQLLSELPGTAVTRMGGLGGTAFLSLRGSTWEQVAIYVDGVPLNLAAGGQVDLSSIALGSIDRIEVYRAMTPIAFGTSALGGVVSITTRLPATTGADAQAGSGSFGTRFGGAAAAYAGDRLRVYGGIHLLGVRGDFPYHWDNGTRYDPSDDETRIRQNNQLTQGDAVLRARLALTEHRALTLSLSGLDRRQGLAGYGIKLAGQTRLTTQRGVASLTYVGDDDLGPGGRFSAQVYTLLTRQPFWDPIPEVAFTTSDSHDRTTTVGATLRARRAIGTALALAAILDGRREQFTPIDQRAGVTTTGDAAVRLYASTGVQADVWWSRARLDVVPSLRWEVSRDVRSGRTQFGTQIQAGDAVVLSEPLARLGLVQHPIPPLALKANVGRYVRRPNFLELFGNSGFLIGDPDLRPEKAVNGDVGVGWRADGARGAIALDAALFAAWVDDLIQFQQDAYGRARPRNIGRARIAGAELAVDARLGRHARLVGQLTFNDARDTSTSTASRDRQLPLRPRYRAYARPELRTWKAGPAAISVYADADVTSGNFLDPANQISVPSRVMFGAGASAALSRAGLRMTASLQNLGNSSISDVAGFPLPGRAVYLTLAGNTDRQTDERTDQP